VTEAVQIGLQYFRYHEKRRLRACLKQSDSCPFANIRKKQHPE
jgi:hypothetical protein